MKPRPPAVAVMLAVLAAASPVRAEEAVLVTLDQAKVIRIAAPAATIIIGNPAIADATLQDAQTLVLTGRAYGTTNMIVLDAEGEPIADSQIEVQAPDRRLVTVHRGPERSSYSCVPVCQPTLVPGDRDDHFGRISSQTASRSGSATGQAGTTSAAPSD